MTSSEALAAVIGREALARTKATSKLWVRLLFGREQVSMFDLVKVLTAHLS